MGVGSGLTPAGWHAVVGEACAATANCVLDAEALFGDPVLYASVRLRNAPDPAAMVEAFETLLRRLLAAGRDAETLTFVAEVKRG